MALIHYQKGDIFGSKAQVIVNTVNCKGVMGKGLALAFKQRYPEMFPVYQQECKTGKLRIGRPSLYQRSNPWILNFPTKNEWKFPSRIEYLEKGLAYFLNNYKKAGITSIAFPKLGAQNGKLSWDDVGPLMAKYLSRADIDVYIYIAEGDKEYQHDLVLEKATKESIWKRFNEFAMSEEQLCQEVQLSTREAKKVMEKRMAMEFTSLTDIESIANLAQISLKRIKDYINKQEYIHPELIGINLESPSPSQPTKKPRKKITKGSRKQSKSVQEVPSAEETLFPRELVS
ncbi:MAG: macro domain-containing protein [Ktedonobacteraceae bacterium]